MLIARSPLRYNLWRRNGKSTAGEAASHFKI